MTNQLRVVVAGPNESWKFVSHKRVVQCSGGAKLIAELITKCRSSVSKLLNIECVSSDDPVRLFIALNLSRNCTRFITEKSPD